MAAERPEATGDRTDWERLRALPEAEIERIAAADPDNPATLSEAEWAEAFAGLSGIAVAAVASDGGSPTKRAVRARFDSDVVAFFERGGRGYQDRMNAVLRRYMEARLRAESGG